MQCSTIVINDKMLKSATKFNEKSRLICLDGDKILVAKYANLFMLPGGKRKQEQSLKECLISEILEETGNKLTENDFAFFKTIDIWSNKYEARDFSIPISRHTKTHYFFTKKKIDLNRKRNLTEKEIKGNFSLQYISINELLDILSIPSNTEKERLYKLELLTIIKSFLKYLNNVDLHTHTSYSDGQYTPDELLRKAETEGISTIAITDHDTISGLKNINNKHKIEIINGIEISCKYPTGRLHILGLDIDYNNILLNELLKKIRQYNINNIENIIQYLKRENITFNREDINDLLTKHSNINRVSIAKLMIQYGYVQSVDDAFKRYLVRAYYATINNREGISHDEAIKAIIQANGIPIIAHPSSLNMTYKEFDDYLKQLIDSGLMGIEIYHPNMSTQDRKDYMRLIEKYNLLFSMGSDFHGENIKPNILLGNHQVDIDNNPQFVLNYINKRKK